VVPVAAAPERRLRIRLENEGNDGAVLGAFRTVARLLPTRDDPLLDRLFALECLLQAGSVARGVAHQLLPARADAAWYVEQEWEPDVPHVAILGQAISTIDAIGEDPPAHWGRRLTEATSEIASRRTKYGLISSPGLLAPVIRGMGVLGLTPPDIVIDGLRSYLTASPDPLVAAQLADALARCRSSDRLAREAARVAFTSPDQGTATAIGRWWLAERWELAHKEPAPANTSDIDQARAQALGSPPPTDAPLPAMLAEVAGRSSGRLLIIPATRLGQIQERGRKHVLIENCAWRVLFSTTLGALALAHLRPIVDWLTKHTGSGPPSPAILQAAVGAIVLIAVTANMTAVQALYRRLGRETPLYPTLITVVLTAAAQLLAYAWFP
jgi:hypothetical protein